MSIAAWRHQVNVLSFDNGATIVEAGQKVLRRLQLLSEVQPDQHL